MENNKKVSVKSKKIGKPIIAPQVKRWIISTSIILALVIAVGGFFAYTAGLPAMVLTGAEIKLTPEGGKAKVIERIKVNELNYLFSDAYSQLQQYGWMQQGVDLDAVYDEETGQTYREFVFEFACNSFLRSVMIEKEARKDKNFRPEAVSYTIERTIEQVRDAVKFNEEVYGQIMSADQYLAQMYGTGTTVSSFSSYIERQMIVDEYLQYLMQEVFMPTSEELTAAAQETGNRNELVTFRYYMFKADYAEGATEDQITAAKAEAESKAEELIARATDGKSFRDICEELAGEEAAAGFADGKDPTSALDYEASTVESKSAEMADFLFSPDRAEGDKAVFNLEEGSVAVYFASRRLDTMTTISYRTIRLNFEGEPDLEGNYPQTEKDKANQKANELIAKITDEKSFGSLAKKYTDDQATRTSGGLVTGVTPETLFSAEEPSEYDQQLALWLMDNTRKAGDRVVLEGDGFVTVVYFVENVPSWQFRLRSNMIDKKYNEWQKSLDDRGELSYEIHYDNVEFASY